MIMMYDHEVVFDRIYQGWSAQALQRPSPTDFKRHPALTHLIHMQQIQLLFKFSTTTHSLNHVR